jgi:hypothetical protein
MDAGARHLVGDRLGHRTRPGAEVDDDRRLEVARRRHGPAGQELGLRARHEDPGSDLELDVPEVRDAREVLQGDAGCPLPDQPTELLRLGGGDVVDERQPGARDAEDEGQELAGVVLRTRNARVAQPLDRDRQQHAPRRLNGIGHCSRASMRDARSVSRHESTTGCRSPSSTWSRL